MAPLAPIGFADGPSRERRAVRLLVASEAVRESTAREVCALLRDADPALLAEVLREQRLEALAALRWRDLGLPGDLRTRFDAVLRASRTRALALEALGEHVCSRLEREGIRALTLKGPWLSRRAFGDPGARLVNDLDVLVPAEGLDAARAALGDLGYRRDENWASEIHETVRAGASLPRIELHWRVHWNDESGFSAAMLDRAEREGPVRVPVPEDELTATLLFAARDGLYGLRGIADAVGLLDHRPAAASALASTCFDHPDLAPALIAAASHVSSLSPGVRIDAPERPSARIRVALRLANPDQAGEIDQLASNVGLMDLLLAPRGRRARAFARYAWLEPAQIRSIYPAVARGALVTGTLRLAQVPKVAARFALGLATAVSARGPGSGASRRGSRVGSPRGEGGRGKMRKARALLAQLAALLRMPPRAIRSYVGLLSTALRTRDRTSPKIAANPRELEPILRAARGARNVVEVGTGTGWTAITLVRDDPERRVTSLDPWVRPERARYVDRLGAGDSERLRLVQRTGEEGPDPEQPPGIDFIFLDSSHTREETLISFETWSPHLRSGGKIAFHDYGNASWPGVAEAIAELGLDGESSHLLFVWTKA